MGYWSSIGSIVGDSIAASASNSSKRKPENFDRYRNKCAKLKQRIEKKRAVFYQNSSFKKNLNRFSSIKADFERNHTF